MREYDPEYLFYHHLSVGLDGYGNLRGNSSNSVSGYNDFDYYRRTYSTSKDYYFWIYPYQGIRYYSNDVSFFSRLEFQGSFKLYPFPGPLFTLIEGDLNSDFSGSWDAPINKNGIAEIKAGFGFGRIIPLFNAYKALKIEEELLDLGELSGKFNRRGLEKISDQIMKKDKYLDERDFWRHLDSIITEAESFKHERLNAVSAIRINEILNGSYKRQGTRAPYISGIDRGFETGFYFGYQYRYSKYNDNDQTREEKYIYSGIRYDFAHPLSVKLNSYGHSSGEWYLSDSLELKEVNIRIGLVYEVFNNFFSDLSVEYCNRKNRYLTGPQNAQYISLDWINKYYIDYKLSVSVIGYLNYYMRSSDDDSNYFSGSLRTSIDYNFF